MPQVPLTQDQVMNEASYLSAWAWAKLNNLIINRQPFNLDDHPYQIITMEREVYDKNLKLTKRKLKVVRKWASQMGKTLGPIIHELHHLIHGFYPQGSMFIFPNTGLAERFSKSRFTPLIDDNAFLRQYINATDTIELKRVGKANLYLVGGKVLQKIAGEQKSSAVLKSEPVDSLNFDEEDEIDEDMVALAYDRIGHSEIKYESHTGTPSIPDFGIDKEYQDSSQMVWMIRCQHCTADTCLELEFPDCITRNKEGRWFRACKKCGKEIFTINGRWIAQFPDREVEGTWISRLNMADKYVNLGKVLEMYENPPKGNKGLVMNGQLGQAHIEAENRLTASDLLAILGPDPMLASHPGPTSMGVDVGNDFHVVILDKPHENSVRLVRAFSAPSNKQQDFSPLHDAIKRYNVRSLVIDMQFAQAQVRKFIMEEAAATGCEIYGNFYQDHYRGVVNWDSKDRIVREDRTEICDNTHSLVVTPGAFILPRQSETMQIFIRHMCNLARVYKEDELTGSREARYRKLGPDHYRHALNYALLASKRVGVYTPKKVLEKRHDRWAEEEVQKVGWLGS